MPNICFNNCKVEGDKISIQNLYTNVNSNNMLLQVMCGLETAPEQPHEVFGTRSECFNLHVVDFQFTEDEAYIEFDFETAWEPPLLAYTTFIKEHVSCSITATYDEWGNSVHGDWTVCDGGRNITHASRQEENHDCEEIVDEYHEKSSDSSSDIDL